MERVEITAIAAGGEGVGRLPDGRAVFVHRVAPGELVDLRVSTQRPRWARGQLLRVISPSEDRREPPCPFDPECGGCTLQHLEYPAQLRAKARVVSDALTRIGGVAVNPPEVVPSPKEFRYRNRVSFSLRRLGGGRVVYGFHSLHDPDRIVEVSDCLLPEAPISGAWKQLCAGWGHNAGRLPSGETLRLTLRATAAGAVTLLVDGGYAPGDPEALLAAVPEISAIWHRREGDAAVRLAGSRDLLESWGEESFEVGGTAFLQVNRKAAALLEQWVEQLVIEGHATENRTADHPAPGSFTPEGCYAPDANLAGSSESHREDLGGLTVVDAYCGVGIRARQLARMGARVTGIELDASAVAIADAARVPGAVFKAARVETALPAALPAHLVVLNPPRAGVDPAVTTALNESPPDRIIYVSCDPATLARDIARLRDHFSVHSVRCFDLFPQTAHVETVVELVRR
ncbi:MAG: TRAM domain-containing protein [Gemmatimonadota bacterium]|jgi:23S rRNA (uracil1939-C5)-methyltransferase|nr:TRAM domain-containing protein [Gemmatimonadota bacterium]